MGYKGPLDARVNAFESSRRVLSDYTIQHAKKLNFSKVGCSVFLPQHLGFFVTRKNCSYKNIENKSNHKVRKIDKLKQMKEYQFCVP